MTWIETIILAIVEGITEFLPVSSTGHMIIASSIMKISHEPLAKIITVNIQFGAILSVVVLYWKRFFTGIDVYFKLFAAFIPAAAIGLLAGDFIDSLLENVWCVAITLFLGGIILIFVDKWFAYTPNNNLEALDSLEEDADVFKLTTDTTAITYKQAFIIGCFQCIAMIPGVSRSASTIIGGMTQKLDRKTAAEFSFLLAVPTMFAASAYKLLKDHDFITSDTIPLLAIGNIVAFIVAMLAIKFFISFLTKYGFRVFGYYRIILGALLLILLLLHVDLAII